MREVQPPGDSFEKPKRRWMTVLLVVLALAIIGSVSYLNFIGTDTPKSVSVKEIKPVTKKAEEPKAEAPKAVEAPKAETATAPKSETETAKTYTVKRGDTLSKIAGTEWRAVCWANNLTDCNKLRPGQVLGLSQEQAQSKAPVQSVKPKATSAIEKPVVVVKTKPAVHPVAQAASGEFIWRVVGGSPLKSCGKKDVAMILDEAGVALGLSQAEREELRALVALSGYEPRITGENRVQLVPGMRFPAVTFCKEGKAVAHTNVLTAWPSDQGVFGERVTLSTGKRLIWVRNCLNLVLDHPAPKPEPTPVIKEPEPQKPEEPVSPGPEPEPLKPISAIPVMGEAEWQFKLPPLKWEAICGAWLGDANQSRFHGHYCEGLLLAELKDGYEIGAGVYGMRGYGGGKAVGSYRWREGNGWGPQYTLKRNFEKEQKDEFGQTLLLPAGWEVKLRGPLHDKVTGNNPVSGYANQQTGKKLGLYAGYYEQTGYDWIYGATAEAWLSYNRRLQSTWSGDRPQDRGSYEVAGYAQYRHNDTWQFRGIASLSHQNWDRLNYLNLAAEARLNETVMCGPRLAFALNKGVYPDSVPRHDLDVRMIYCRVELGGKIRAFWKDENQKSVRYVGPASGSLAQAPPSNTD